LVNQSKPDYYAG